jgi:hypothetical protein
MEWPDATEELSPSEESSSVGEASSGKESTPTATTDEVPPEGEARQ